MDRRTLLYLLTAAVVGGLWFVLTADRSNMQPSLERMKTLAGTDLPTPPRYTSNSLGRRIYTEIRITVQMWRLPIPNGMYMHPRGNTWTYVFEADSTYRPPDDGPFACEERRSLNRLRCRTEPMERNGERWSYTLTMPLNGGEAYLNAALLDSD